MREITRIKLPDGCTADFALRVTGDECEPYIPRGGAAYIEVGAEMGIGDVGLFLAGREAVIRQYCEDWAGNALLLALNRRRSALDVVVPASEKVFYFGKVQLKEAVPLPTA